MAAWSVNDIYNLVKFLVRKNQAGGVSSTDLFYAWNSEQRSYFQDLVGRWQARSLNKTGVNTGLVQNQNILTELSPFTKSATLTFTAGLAPKPTDFIFKLAIRVNGYRANQINHDQIASVNDSVLDPPSVPNNQYYYVEYESDYSILPSSVASAALDYICDVQDVVWAYTLDGDGRQVYDAGNSVQPLWNNSVIVTITKRVLSNMGISFKDGDFNSFGRSAQQTGD